jgi:hypothetical protein
VPPAEIRDRFIEIFAGWKMQSRMNLLSSLRERQRWFFVGCMVLGAAVPRLPFLSEPNGNMAVVPYFTSWFGCGFAAGLLVPDRPWRWGVAMVIGRPIAGFVFNPGMALVALVAIRLSPWSRLPSSLERIRYGVCQESRARLAH